MKRLLATLTPAHSSARPQQLATHAEVVAAHLLGCCPHEQRNHPLVFNQSASIGRSSCTQPLQYSRERRCSRERQCACERHEEKLMPLGAVFRHAQQIRGVYSAVPLVPDEPIAL